MKDYKKDFPILSQTIHGKPLVYLDSSASSQKPQVVIDAIANFYRQDYANIHRGVYQLSERATAAFEKTRVKIKNFIHAAHAHEIIFTRNTTESINLVAQSYGRTFLKEGDEIIISAMEHHSNIVPWQILQEQCGIKLKIIPLSDSGELDLERYQRLFSPRTKLVAIAHASNILGTINPIKKMIEIAHAAHALVLVDGAQAFPHLAVDMKELDCDFYAFSAHKAYGPTGIGVLYGKTQLLEKMPPYQTGGSMIETVSFEKTTYAPLPIKFEAGTPNIADAIGFHAALNYLEQITMPEIVAHELALLEYATPLLTAIPGITLLGTATEKLGVLSFTLDKVHPHDIGTILDREGIAVRVGHHCSMPLMERLNIPACVRASFGIYNTLDDVNCLMAGIETVKQVFTRGC